ncbi:MAG: hypothetical protein NVSMB7_12740 [Chitinophagaceae bacterium]
MQTAVLNYARGFNFNEEKNLYHKTEFRVTYFLSQSILNDYDYWYGKQKFEGVQDPSLKDFTEQYYNKKNIEVVVWPADVPETPFYTDVIQQQLKQRNPKAHMPSIGESWVGRNQLYVVTESRIEYVGNF